MPSQTSSLLPALFAPFEDGQPLRVLHMGPALPETVAFFSRYRCKLHFIDLFSELSRLQSADSEAGEARQLLAESMAVPADARFDLCLFWDLFNFMEPPLIRDFLAVLQPHLHPGTVAHGFAVHNLKTPQHDQLYGISGVDKISIRPRTDALPGYRPHNQGQLERWLHCFSFNRSVLLPNSRLEMLLAARS